MVGMSKPQTAETIRFVVWDDDAGEHIAITRSEAAKHCMNLAARIGSGTPAAGEWERKALEITNGGTAGFMTVPVLPGGEVAWP